MFSLLLFLLHQKIIFQKKKGCMNMYEHISYIIIHVYEYLCLFMYVYTYL